MVVIHGSGSVVVVVVSPRRIPPRARRLLVAVAVAVAVAVVNVVVNVVVVVAVGWTDDISRYSQA
jgi:hypothetical protein